MRERPIFIFGCPRSGTSLLSRILNAHPRIAIPFESHVYHYLYTWKDLYGDLSDSGRRTRMMKDLLSMEDIKEWRPRPSLEDALEAVDSYDFHGVFEGLISSWARSQGKPRWGEKTPQHTLYWRGILEGFPDLQVIHIVRDGRDLALSYKKAFFGPVHMYPIACRWIKFLEAAREAARALGDDAYAEVRYEDLISDPEPTVRKLCSFLNEDYVPEMIASPHPRTRYPTDRENERNLRQPILASNAGKWRTEMSPRDLRIFESTAAEYLIDYGYEPMLERRELSRSARLFYKYVEHAPVKAWSMLNNRKSRKITWQRLQIYTRLRLKLF